MQPSINPKRIAEAIVKAQLGILVDGETRAFGGDTEPGARLTIGRGWEESDWGLWWGHYGQRQAGRPPHGCGYPFWTVTGIYSGSQAAKIARALMTELDRQLEAARARPKRPRR